MAAATSREKKKRIGFISTLNYSFSHKLQTLRGMQYTVNLRH